MFKTFSKLQTIQHFRRLYITAIILIALHNVGAQRLYEGDTCAIKSIGGVCTLASKCTTLEPLIKQKQITSSDILRCGYGIYEEIVCCPIIRTRGQSDTETTTSTTSTTTTTIRTTPTISTTTTKTPTYIITTPTPTTTTTTTKEPTHTITTTESYSETPAKKACNIIEANGPDTNELDDSEQILTQGDFRFVGEIGFKILDKPLEPVSYECTGTLINSKFVLTAAHCFNNRSKEATMVRFGITNSFHEEQMTDAVYGEINIIHLHPKYTPDISFHNIAIVELNNPISYTKYVYPICLETEYDDSTELKLMVSYWQPGAVRDKNFKFLLRAVQANISLSSCENSYIANSAASHMESELRRTQMCTEFTIFNQKLCISANGDPLLTLDSNNNYRVLGIFSGASKCNTNSVTNLFTRVDAYIDFIERIVWPQEVLSSQHNAETNITTATTIIQSTTTIATPYIIPTTTTTIKPTTKEPIPTFDDNFSERSATKACNLIEANGPDTIELDDSEQILTQGVFRFVGEIGFKILDKPLEPVSYECTGTLINSKFVLTAAHCFNNRYKEPRMVRFGISNSNQEQLKNAVYEEIDVIHVHSKYIFNTSFHDIAIVELKNPISNTKYVYPICLETMYDDSMDLKLMMSYWETGTISNTNVTFLLKANQEEISLNSCENSYIVSGVPNHMQQDLQDTQICTKFKIPEQEYYISSNGDPLLTLDSNSNYRIFGIFSGASNYNSSNSFSNLFIRIDAYLDFIERIVWPDEIQSSQHKTTTTEPSYFSTIKTTTIEPTPMSTVNFKEHLATKACNIIEANGPDTNELDDSEQILTQGDFRFVGEIGFKILDKPLEPVSYECTGTLINSKFVLTAAHCFNNRSKEARMVRFGITNSFHEEQMTDAVYGEINIIHLHPKYTPDISFHNIAIVELNNPISYTKYVYPICLETEYDDSTELKLMVSYWQPGAVRDKNFKFLLKAVQADISLSSCENSYIANSAASHMESELRHTQMCTEFTIFNQKLCISANGDPLLTLDSNNNYRVLGIFSGASKCNTNSVTNLFTRVDAYIDFIERIVWPQEVLSSQHNAETNTATATTIIQSTTTIATPYIIPTTTTTIKPTTKVPIPTFDDNFSERSATKANAYYGQLLLQVLERNTFCCDIKSICVPPQLTCTGVYTSLT
ncbi:transmembrane protease serine 9-like [Teleopsis dalmanni]|uniref:transmembrane protease serine 9-like n=1 Tax=Teleopsis dalmanni TaxID=139649 RepID=UPI0018CE3339|nr:transmembrane protease serine 9-like [Teleopsis dalmanni]